MTDHRPSEHTGASTTFGREIWNTRAGFILAAVGSAVGLGNMWRFSYSTAENGGAAFVALYILLTFMIGIPIMIAEFGLGRSARLSPIGALRNAGGRRWSSLGYVFVAAGFIILSYYSVIAGWATRYALGALVSPFPADAGAYFDAIATGTGAMAYHLVFMAITVFIVAGGVKKGIERASLTMMPILVVIMIGLAIYAATLPGAGEGYSFYLTPSLHDLFALDTLASAAGQAFFSLSLGMGAMLTFASYLSRDSSLPKEATTIAFADFGIAFIAGLVVFPVVFALGLQAAVGESTVGGLFIALPGAFEAMGAAGRGIGIFFFLALFIGAVTSAVSLLEVVTSSVIDEWKLDRKKAAIGAGALIAIIGLAPASNLDILGALDAVASEVLLPLGGFLLAILVGWRMPDAIEIVGRGASPRVRSLLNGWRWTLRLAVPPLMILVLWQTVPGAFEGIRALVAF
jgi:neurotransmitter:Na+ symporter, NSS family